MSFVRVWVHIGFSTKNRKPLLNDDFRNTVFDHILKNAKEKNIWLDCVNGYNDHIHCLISINKDQSISKVVQLIKGESSFWINKNKLTKFKFLWQDDYWAVSVSESNVQSVRNYIRTQETHHRKKTFNEEVNDFLGEYNYNVAEAGIISK